MSVLDQRLSDFDPEIAELIGKELERQRSGLEMIASENHAPLAVMQAQGSVLTNRYAEGYPGGATTAAASMSTSSSSWRSIATRRCSTPNSPTCNRTLVRRPTRRSCTHCSSRATPSSGSRSTAAVTLRTACG